METFIGVWVDFNKAYISRIEKKVDRHEPSETFFVEKLSRIESESAPQFNSSQVARTRNNLSNPKDIASERKFQERRQHQLHEFFVKVLRQIHDADKIYIMGPGEAKLWLKKEIDKNKIIASRIQDIETTDKLTEKQIAAKIRKYFGLVKVENIIDRRG